MSRTIDLRTVQCRSLRATHDIGNLYEAQGEKSYALIDFWTSSCTRCPGALEKLNNHVRREKLDVEFISVNLDSYDIALDIVSKNNWNCMKHVSVSSATRETLKDMLNMKFVPFLLFISKGGHIIAAGSMKDVPVEHLQQLIINKRENISIANIPPIIVKYHDEQADSCAGGVCLMPSQRILSTRKPLSTLVQQTAPLSHGTLRFSMDEDF